MRELLNWVDQIASHGTVTEDEAYLELAVPLSGVSSHVVETVLDPGPVPASVRVWVALGHDVEPIRYVRTARDVTLEPWLADRQPCVDHWRQYAELYKQQEEGARIDPGRRLALLHEMAACSACQLPFALHTQLHKSEALDTLLLDRGWRVPPQVTVRVWLDQPSMMATYTLDHMLKWPARATLLAVRWEWDLACDYIRCVALSDEKFWERFLMSCEALAHQSDTLLDILNAENADRPTGLTLLPPAYWVSTQAVRNGRMSTPLARELHAADMLGLSVLAYCSTTIEWQAGRLTFVVDRDYRAEATVLVGPEGVTAGAHNLDLFGQQAALIDFYRGVLQGVRPRGNPSLVQTAVLMAGDGSLLALLSSPQRIQAYYTFQYESLLEDRFKQQAEITRTYLAQRQDARAKAGAAVNELYKNMATVATALGALLILILSSALKENKPGTYLVLAGALISVLYVPAHFIWTDNTVDETMDRLRDFEENMRWSAKTLKYPESKLELPGFVGGLVRTLTARTTGVLLYLALVFMVGLGMCWYGYYQKEHDLGSWDPTWRFPWLFWGWLVIALLLAGRRLNAWLGQVVKMTEPDRERDTAVLKGIRKLFEGRRN